MISCAGVINVGGQNGMKHLIVASKGEMVLTKTSIVQNICGQGNAVWRIDCRELDACHHEILEVHVCS